MNRPSCGRRFLAWGGLAGTLLAASVGCSQSAALVRGQSPDESVGIARAADMQAAPIFRAQSPDRAMGTPAPKPKHNTKLVSHEGAPVSSGTLASGEVVGGYPSGYCPPGGEYCPPHGHGMPMPGIPCPGVPCPGGALAGYHYSYKDPGCPVYPPGTGPGLTGPGTPGAVVQYPYYTTKGPDDFFLDQDGRF